MFRFIVKQRPEAQYIQLESSTGDLYSLKTSKNRHRWVIYHVAFRTANWELWSWQKIAWLLNRHTVLTDGYIARSFSLLFLRTIKPQVVTVRRPSCLTCILFVSQFSRSPFNSWQTSIHSTVDYHLCNIFVQCGTYIWYRGL